jgi:hypothetical protein
MAKIAEHRGDFTSRFQNAIYRGDVEDRIQMFKEVDLCMLPILPWLFSMTYANCLLQIPLLI